MDKKDIERIQEEVEKHEKKKPKPAEKRLKIGQGFDEVLKKIAKSKKKK